MSIPAGKLTQVNQRVSKRGIGSFKGDRPSKIENLKPVLSPSAPLRINFAEASKI
jgi:hypothetical protein